MKMTLNKWIKIYFKESVRTVHNDEMKTFTKYFGKIIAFVPAKVYYNDTKILALSFFSQLKI